MARKSVAVPRPRKKVSGRVMTDQDCTLNIIVIDQWIDDLLDTNFGIKFNADVPYGRTPKGKLMGDAALFLAYRQVAVNDDEELFKWLSAINVPPDEDYLVSELVVHTFTRIPLKESRALLWPQELLNHPEYDLAKMTPKHFVRTLRTYLETGIVSWEWLLPDGKR